MTKPFRTFELRDYNDCTDYYFSQFCHISKQDQFVSFQDSYNNSGIKQHETP